MKNIFIYLIIFIPLFSQDENSIVKIEVTIRSPHIPVPWAGNSPESASGTGFVIEGNKIITNAHVVEYQTFIQVRKTGTVKYYTADIDFISNQVDLAILTVRDASFFDNVIPLSFGSLPEIQDEILVVGYPIGGDDISYSLGIVSRIEVTNYVHSLEENLLIQVDAAINSGNSGGPAFLGTEVIGIATQTNLSAENLGYIIPTPVINQFLVDVKDGEVNGVPNTPVSHQPLNNPMLRNYFKIDENSDIGILIYSIRNGDELKSNLKKGDILISVDGNDIFYNAKSNYDNQLFNYSFHISKRQVGDEIEYIVIRDGEKKIIKDKVFVPKLLVPLRNHNINPEYFVYGGFIFAPLNNDYSNYFEEMPLNLALFYQMERTENRKEIVILQSIMKDELNVGYWENDAIIKINETPIKSFRTFIEDFENAKRWVKLQFYDNSILIIDKDRLNNATHKMILDKYNIPSDKYLY